jgi:hypothetical protein
MLLFVLPISNTEARTANTILHYQTAMQNPADEITCQTATASSNRNPKQKDL